jgi:tetratricopeptide (TPR) repeat protein
MNEIIQRCLRKNVAERFTAAELVTALDAQIGRAKTAPYTNANAVTAATPTLLTGSQLKTVQEPAQPRRRSALPAVIIVLVIALAAAAGVIATHRSAPAPLTPTVAPKTETAAASTTSVNVTAPPEVIEEHKPDVVTKSVPEPVTTTTADVAPEPQPATESNADALYATAMSEILGGDPQQARKTLHRVLKQDPHYAKAHFRLGEIALLNRNLIPATEELNLALTDSDRLDAREQQLTRIGLAVAEDHRSEVLRLADDFWQQWPGDPDLTRMRATFPVMFLELPRERFQPQRRRRH